MEGQTATPDLQAILSTLAQFANPVPNAATPERTPTPPDGQGLQQSRAADPRLQPKPQNRSTATVSPQPQQIDPATITTWQDGLRCVTKIAAQNAQFSAAIRRMMADQRKHEQRWYSERQNLKLTQANRATSAARAQSILRGLSGAAASEPLEASESSTKNEAELAAFHRKIYDAQVQMEAAMSLELKALGVPFFGTEPRLVVADENELADRAAGEVLPKWSPVVTKKQLMDLRRRMVDHLEDLYRD